MLISNAFPSAINAAATFNRTLMRRRATEMGAEFRGKGINVALAPAMYVVDAYEHAMGQALTKNAGMSNVRLLQVETGRGQLASLCSSPRKS